MQRYYSVPLLFFVLAALLGLFLRWQFVRPTPGVNFTYFLHGHSHVMFLGWVFNALYLSSIENHIDLGHRKPYITLFFFLQVLVIAMMISFPIQGYGGFSIAFSTTHTLAVMIFIPVFFRHSKRHHTLSSWFSRVAWIFFFISTLGPFALGYLMATGMGNTVWNNFSIYYYLHFQYNGFFLFGIFSLFFRFLEEEQIAFSQKRAKAFGKLMGVACVPAYFLSVLFARPPEVFYWLAATGAAIQIFAVCLVLTEMRRIAAQLKGRITSMLVPIVGFIMFAFIFKLLLQLASAHPLIAELAFALRPVVIAYLHLVLVGIISLFLMGWYVQRRFMSMKLAQAGFVTLMAGFLGSEIALVLLPWWRAAGLAFVHSPTLIFALSILMAIAAVIFYCAFLLNPEGSVDGNRLQQL